MFYKCLNEDPCQELQDKTHCANHRYCSWSPAALPCSDCARYKRLNCTSALCALGLQPWDDQGPDVVALKILDESCIFLKRSRLLLFKKSQPNCLLNNCNQQRNQVVEYLSKKLTHVVVHIHGLHSRPNSLNAV